MIDLMENLKRTERTSLLKAKDNVAEAIKESKTLLNKIKSVMEAENKVGIFISTFGRNL